MGEQKDWTEWIKDLSNWVKGSIGLVTLIVGFVVLFQNNPYLTVTVSVAVVLVAVFCCGIYLAFSKQDSKIIGGSRVYRFPKYRRWALVIAILIPILAVILLADSSNRSFIVVSFSGTPTPTSTSTLTPSPTLKKTTTSTPTSYTDILPDSTRVYFPGDNIGFHDFYPAAPSDYNLDNVWIQDNIGNFSEYFDEVINLNANISGMEAPPSVSAVYDPVTGKIITSPPVNLPAGAQLHLHYKVHLLSNIPSQYLPLIWQAGGDLGDLGDCDVPPGYSSIHTTTYMYLDWGEEAQTRVSSPSVCYAILPHSADN